MIKKAILLTTMCIGHIYSFFDIEELNREYDGKVLLTQEQVNGMYQLMKDVHDLFTWYGIEYWIQGGTLVGAVRQQGLLWWDDDFDINIKGTEKYRLFEIEHLLNKLGYIIKSYPMTNITKEGIGGIDIFTTCHCDNYTKYTQHWWMREEKDIFVYDEELYPLRLYKFGDLELWGPNDYHAYLRWGFGEEYMQKVYIYNHKKTDWIMCYLEELAIHYQKAATMTIPLENRVEALLATLKN